MEWHARAGRQRLRITIGLVVVGSLLWPTGLVLGVARAAGILPASFGHDGFLFAFSLPGLFVMLLAVLPTDARVIRMTYRITAAYCLAGGTLVLAMVVLALAGLSSLKLR